MIFISMILVCDRIALNSGRRFPISSVRPFYLAQLELRLLHRGLTKLANALHKCWDKPLSESAEMKL